MSERKPCLFVLSRDTESLSDQDRARLLRYAMQGGVAEAPATRNCRLVASEVFGRRIGREPNSEAGRPQRKGRMELVEGKWNTYSSSRRNDSPALLSEGTSEPIQRPQALDGNEGETERHREGRWARSIRSGDRFLHEGAKRRGAPVMEGRHNRRPPVRIFLSIMEAGGSGCLDS